SECLVVPFGDDDLAVRVEAGDEQEDHVVENLLYQRRVFGSQAVNQFKHHLGRADLGRMAVPGNKQDGLAGTDYFVTLGIGRRAAVKVELSFELFQMFKVLY